jgi:DNA invertase Pin-like site-specific DNA recombinase
MTTSLPTSVRVAIYTRKSTEEGLEQEFNSLDAQREAALAYIANRRHLYWQVVPDEYNDGGYTGGNLERPALQRLLGDIRQGKIDCVVTYKLDRISRSLIDFAQLMTLFEHHGVAFVSITQEFDSSTPVGRLTLNILSSFSQFEREIISERTRDKMAASRKRGMFVGGFPPFGYDIDPQTHRLIVNPAEAEIVSEVFTTFLAVQSVTAVMHAFNAKGYRTKTFTSRRGRIYEGNPWCKFYVRRVLTNPLYIGQIRYRGQLYAGQQEPIIALTQWQQVQALLPPTSDDTTKSSMPRQVALLRGLLRCGHCGCAMTPSSCRKPNKAYRYYICSTSQRHGERTCPVRSIPAGELETVVVQELRALFRTPERLTTALRDRQADHADTRLMYQAVVALQQLDRTWNGLYPAVQQRIIRLLIETVTVYPDRVDIRIRAEGLNELGQDPLFNQEVSRG